MAAWVGVVSEYFVSLDGESRRRYIEKLKKYQIKVDPLWNRESKAVGGSESQRTDSATWSPDKKCFPPITYPDIYNYLIDCSSPYSKEDLKAYKSLQGYKYLTAGYVHAVEAQQLEAKKDGNNTERKVLIRGKVSEIVHVLHNALS